MPLIVGVTLVAILLSLGAIDALIPLIIIFILVAAAAGSMRGYSLFNLFGIATLAGFGSAAGRGSLAKKNVGKIATAGPFQLSRTGGQIAAGVKLARSGGLRSLSPRRSLIKAGRGAERNVLWSRIRGAAGRPAGVLGSAGTGVGMRGRPIPAPRAAPGGKFGGLAPVGKVTSTQLRKGSPVGNLPSASRAGGGFKRSTRAVAFNLQNARVKMRNARLAVGRAGSRAGVAIDRVAEHKTTPVTRFDQGTLRGRIANRASTVAKRVAFAPIPLAIKGAKAGIKYGPRSALMLAVPGLVAFKGYQGGAQARAEARAGYQTNQAKRRAPREIKDAQGKTFAVHDVTQKTVFGRRTKVIGYSQVAGGSPISGTPGLRLEAERKRLDILLGSAGPATRPVREGQGKRIETEGVTNVTAGDKNKSSKPGGKRVARPSDELKDSLTRPGMLEPVAKAKQKLDEATKRVEDRVGGSVKDLRDVEAIRTAKTLGSSTGLTGTAKTLAEDVIAGRKNMKDVITSMGLKGEAAKRAQEIVDGTSSVASASKELRKERTRAKSAENVKQLANDYSKEAKAAPKEREQAEKVSPYVQAGQQSDRNILEERKKHLDEIAKRFELLTQDTTTRLKSAYDRETQIKDSLRQLGEGTVPQVGDLGTKGVRDMTTAEAATYRSQLEKDLKTAQKEQAAIEKQFNKDFGKLHDSAYGISSPIRYATAAAKAIAGQGTEDLREELGRSGSMSIPVFKTIAADLAIGVGHAADKVGIIGGGMLKQKGIELGAKADADFNKTMGKRYEYTGTGPEANTPNIMNPRTGTGEGPHVIRGQGEVHARVARDNEAEGAPTEHRDGETPEKEEAAGSENDEKVHEETQGSAKGKAKPKSKK